MTEAKPDAAVERFTRLAARLLDVPVALVSRSGSLCRQVVSDRRPLAIADARLDARVADNLAVRDLPVIAYLGVPLTTSDGQTLGALCAIDHSPRDWSADDMAVLEELAEGVVGEFELRAAQARTERDLRAARERAQAILAGMREGYALTVHGEIIEVNDALCRMTGFGRDELIGARTPFPFWPPAMLEDTLALRDRIVAAEGGTFELKVMRKDGSFFDGEVTAEPARKADGTLLGFVNTLRDISEAKRHRVELERERHALQEAQQLARLGSWSYDVLSNRPGTWSPELWRMLALEPQATAPALPAFLAMIHAEDRDRVALRIAQAMAAREPFVDEFRMIAADGRELRVGFRAEPELDAQGTRIGAYGTIQDITERANREREEIAVREIAQLVAQAAGPEAVFEHVARQVCEVFGGHSGVVVRFDEQRGRAVFVNAVTRDGSAISGTELDLEGESAPARVYRTKAASRTGGARTTGHEPDFAPVVAQISDAVAAPITVAGRVWGCLAASFSEHRAPGDTEQRLERFADLVGMAIANAEAWEALSHQATTDSLTGLANQRVFRERLEAEVERARRYGRHLALVLLDLDRFKAINDTYGHQTGDRVLMEVGRRLAAQARGAELVARIGGEEFAWLLPETDREAAVLAAERMRRTIESAPFDHVGALTVSSGVCAMENGLDADDLVRLADRALYWAKDGGRNTTFLYTEEAQALLTRR